MSNPSVAIVGRPNVGKSTLFNRLVGSRIAIEAKLPGVTRDRVLYPLTIEERSFDLIDTGGIGIVDRQNLHDQVERQIGVAIEEADLLLFVVDCREEITPLDQEVADRLRRCGRAVLLVANKVDTGKLEDALPSFHRLGFGDAVAISAKQDRNIDDLEAAILKRLPPASPDEEPVELRELMKIAFVGRRNAGKSTMINQLVGAERVIVSDVPGTTRDATDILVERDGLRFIAIDTAGLRRRKQYEDVMEFYGNLRTERAIRRADVCVLMIDALHEIGRVEKGIGAALLEEYKPSILALNKWDLALERNPEITVEAFQAYVSDNLPGMHFCRLAGLSAKTGKNVWPLMQEAMELHDQARQPCTTGALNSAVAEAYRKRRPRPYRGKLGKIYYGTQVSLAPPTFVLFCNNPKAFDDNYRRYLANHLREALGYPDIPVRLFLRLSGDRDVGRYTG